jgi:hypothetical protein
MVAQAILAAFTIFKVVTSKANPKTGLAFCVGVPRMFDNWR